jgi:prostaglandin-endoperoxide synthase 2
MTAAARQPAAALGALNTDAAIIGIETLAVNQARFNHLASYNAYRVRFGMSAVTAFDQISSDPRIVAILEGLYPTPADVELYPGLFCEDRVRRSPLPGLLLRMVGVDAFSQALTNPLLAQHVFNADTFTPWGFQLIKDTHSLGDILVQQGEGVDAKAVTMTQAGWRY